LLLLLLLVAVGRCTDDEGNWLQSNNSYRQAIDSATATATAIAAAAAGGQ
jgi:hypothetical protein